MSANSAEKIKRLESLDGREMAVLTFIMADKDIKIIDVAKRMLMGESTTRNVLTRVYNKLRVPDKERDKRGYLHREYLEVYTERFLHPKGVNGGKELMRVLDQKMPLKNPPPGGYPDDEPPYQLPEGYVEDERDLIVVRGWKEENRERRKAGPAINTPPPPARTNRVVLIGGMLGGFCLISMIAIALLSSVIRGFNTSPSTVDYNPPAVIEPTAAPQVAVVQPTSAPAVVKPTEKPVSIPTPAPKDYYGQNDPAYLREGVMIYLDPSFRSTMTTGSCPEPNPGWGVNLWVENKSSNEFLARFDRYAFSAVDNTGKTYDLKGSGFYYCEISPGAVSQTVKKYGKDQLILIFAGQIPLEAKYIDITIEDISGSGKIVFRKDM